MAENKNGEMSVEELLKLLEESVKETGEIKEEAPQEEAAKAEEAIEEVIDAVEETVEEAVEDTEDASEIAQELPVSEKNEITEEDIYTALGITAEELEKQTATAAAAAEAVKEAEDAPLAPTKVYYIKSVEKKDEFRLRKAAESQRKTVDYDRDECDLIKQALGIEKAAEYEEQFDAITPEKDIAPTMTIDIPRDEFTYQRQKEDIALDYKRARRSSVIKLILTALSAIALFLVECLPSLGVTMPNAFNPDYYPVVYAMTAMQFAWIACALCYKEIANGFLAMRVFKITSGGVLGLFLVFGTACDIVNCTMGMRGATYNFAIAFAALLVRAFEYMDIRREMASFEIASSAQSQKRVVLPAEQGQVNKILGLEDYCGEDSQVLRTEKCSFVENYFARTEKRSESESVSNKYLVPVIFAAAIATAVVCGLSGGFDAVLTAFNSSIAVALPMLILLSAAYPLYKAAMKLSHIESAIIGETAVEEYSGTTMICFDDADAFPSYGVTLENLRIYGKGDIETIIEQMDAVFSKLGGPLRSVFALMISECPKPYRVKIDGVYDNGIKATVDGKTLYIGSAEYIAKNGFVVTDRTNEIGGKTFSTMYLAEDGALRAKFFIRYTLDGSFETIIKKLARRGIASVILTGDSNINDELLAQFIDVSKLPVKVVRRSVDDSPLRSDRADSGIVSAGSVKDLVSTVTMCDKLAGVIGTMRAVRIASAIMCALIVLAIALLNMSSVVSSLYVLIYHLFWLVPAWIVTKFNLG
nr:hypothetical protein [Clostridia bacterium]